ncbi:prenyltransferase/squalene oxidase repeat-containing protein [Dactylosporangium sp. CA-152071]|uniref:prenyltransferase/squalene oxidase repeat-containing protein n=1 Tax=Dactylosporangium sp. CA-152071 TaxID=3239933 RepID=UPI003D92D1F8
MVDLDAAIGYVVAHGDAVDRARLAWLRTGQSPPADVLEQAEIGQSPDGGWPALWGADVASVDATCFRLGELDDLGAIDRPAARRALGWLGRSQRPDGMWEEDAALAGIAPPWAQPGDDEAKLYLTTNAAYWLVVGGPNNGDDQHATRVARAAEAFRASLRPDGSWPSFLVAGWLGCAVLFHLGWFYESAQIQVALADRVPEMTPADTASLYAALRRVRMSPEDWLLSAARKRLSETQRSDGGWESDDGAQFNVHTTLTAIRALR